MNRFLFDSFSFWLTVILLLWRCCIFLIDHGEYIHVAIVNTLKVCKGFLKIIQKLSFILQKRSKFNLSCVFVCLLVFLSDSMYVCQHTCFLVWLVVCLLIWLLVCFSVCLSVPESLFVVKSVTKDRALVLFQGTLLLTRENCPHYYKLWPNNIIKTIFCKFIKNKVQRNILTITISKIYCLESIRNSVELNFVNIFRPSSSIYSKTPKCLLTRF